MAFGARPPANDLFANRQVLPSTNFLEVAGFNGGASKETGEPNHNTGDTNSPGTNPGGRSVWWQWTAPANGAYVVTTLGSKFDTMLGVYQGNSVTGLVKVAANDNMVAPFSTPLPGQENDFVVLSNVLAGETYQIAVDGRKVNGIIRSGVIKLTISQITDNDLFANRAVLTNSNINILAFNGLATKETGERSHTNGLSTANPLGKSLWWEWRAPAPGTYLISTYPATFDSWLAVYRPTTGGTVANMTRISAPDQANYSNEGSLKANLFPLVADTNTVYLIAVDGQQTVAGGVTNVASGLFTLSIRPDNDNVANATPLTGAPTAVMGFNGKATVEEDVGLESTLLKVNTQIPGKSLWWRWQPPANGDYIITTAGSTFDTFLAVFTNKVYQPTATITNLKGAGNNWPNYSDTDSAEKGDVTSALVMTNMLTNIAYYIMVDSQYNLDYEDHELPGVVQLRIIPDNDRLANRTFLSGAKASSASLNSQSGSENPTGWNEKEVLYDLADFYAFSRDRKSVWWSWTAPTNGRLTVDTVGSSFSTFLVVYEKSGPYPQKTNLVAHNVNTPETDFQSLVELAVVPGREYLIQVSGTELDESGGISLNVDFTAFAPPQNDAFQQAEVLTGTSVQLTATNEFATKEPGEANHGGVRGGRSLWWQWTPLSDGLTTVSTMDSESWLLDGESLDTVIAVYTNDHTSTPRLIASNRNDTANNLVTSFLTFQAKAGLTYFIAVDGEQHTITYPANILLSYPQMEVDYGLIRLSLDQIPMPANDNFANRILLTNLPASALGMNVNATAEANEPAHVGMPGGASVWWSWRAPVSGPVAISTEGSDFDTLLAVYTGTTLSNLVLIAENDDAGAVVYSRVYFNAVANQVYQIAVDGLGGGSGAIRLKITPPVSISAPLMTPNRSFRLSFPTSADRVYEILVSEDLRNWNPLDLLDGTGNEVEFEDSEAAWLSSRFYKIVEY